MSSVNTLNCFVCEQMPALHFHEKGKGVCHKCLLKYISPDKYWDYKKADIDKINILWKLRNTQ